MFYKSQYIIKIVFIIVLAFAISIVSSCTKDDDSNTEIEGTTITGEWKCNDNESENGLYDAQSFTIDIYKPNTDYTISNFGNLGINFKANASINGSSITVNEQTIDNITIHGSGTFSNNNSTVNFTYYVDDEKIASVWNKN